MTKAESTQQLGGNVQLDFGEELHIEDIIRISMEVKDETEGLAIIAKRLSEEAALDWFEDNPSSYDLLLIYPAKQFRGIRPTSATIKTWLTGRIQVFDDAIDIPYTVVGKAKINGGEYDSSIAIAIDLN